MAAKNQVEWDRGLEMKCEDRTVICYGGQEGEEKNTVLSSLMSVPIVKCYFLFTSLVLCPFILTTVCDCNVFTVTIIMYVVVDLIIV